MNWTLDKEVLTITSKQGEEFTKELVDALAFYAGVEGDGKFAIRDGNGAVCLFKFTDYPGLAEAVRVLALAQDPNCLD